MNPTELLQAEAADRDSLKKSAIIKSIIVAILFICLLFLIAGCKKDHNPFKIGDKVKLDGINPRASYQPYDCCTCTPCVVTNAYPNDMDYWYYDIKDLRGVPLTHVLYDELKKY